MPANRGRNVTLLGAISSNRIVAYDIFIGSLNAEKFNNFLEHMLIPNLNDNEKTIVMDNCRAHKTHSTQTLVSRFFKTIKFLPPYSPQFNPIEEFFSSVKARFRRDNLIEKTAAGLKTKLTNILESYDVDLRQFYNHMRTFINPAKAKQQFL